MFPVAPPRLMTDMGFVDTLAGVSKINLHAGVFSRWFNADAAMPSMHFGYAFMIGVVGAFLVSNWALRVLALAYPTLVFITITGTANHYIADSLVGALVIAAGFVLVQVWMMVWPRMPATVVRHRRSRRTRRAQRSARAPVAALRPATAAFGSPPNVSARTAQFRPTGDGGRRGPALPSFA